MMIDGRLKSEINQPQVFREVADSWVIDWQEK